MRQKHPDPRVTPAGAAPEEGTGPEMLPGRDAGNKASGAPVTAAWLRVLGSGRSALSAPVTCSCFLGTSPARAHHPSGRKEVPVGRGRAGRGQINRVLAPQAARTPLPAGPAHPAPAPLRRKARALGREQDAAPARLRERGGRRRRRRRGHTQQRADPAASRPAPEPRAPPRTRRTEAALAECERSDHDRFVQ